MIERAKIPKNDVFNINKVEKNKIINRVHTIKEINEEYLNEIKDIKTKKPKYNTKYDQNISNAIENKINKIKKKKIIISSSLSEEKHKKLEKQKGNEDKDKDNIDNENKNKLRPRSKMNFNFNSSLKNKNNLVSFANKSSINDGKKQKKMPKNIKSNHSCKT